MTSRGALVGLLALSLLEATALAQPAPAPQTPGPKAAAPAPDPRHKDEAREHFQRGLALFDSEAWDAALAEFTRARTLYPTRAAIKNAGQCLRLLHRYDEALDTFEELLALPNLSKDEQEVGEREVAALRRLVGSVVIANAESGSTIVIDGRSRGSVPSPPLRVSAGTHTVRVSKEGFEPFWSQVNVAGDESVLVSARLVRYGPTGPAPGTRPAPKPDPLLVPAVVALGAGGLGLAAGTVLGVLTLNEVSAIRTHCTANVCPTNQMPAGQTASTTATLSTASLVVGGALAATGLTLLLVRSRASAPSTALVIGPGSVMARGGF